MNNFSDHLSVPWVVKLIYQSLLSCFGYQKHRNQQQSSEIEEQ